MAGRRHGHTIGAYYLHDHDKRTETPASVGDVIYAARAAARLSQAALAEKTGIGRAMLAHLERGRKIVTPDHWKALTAALPALADAPVKVERPDYSSWYGSRSARVVMERQRDLEEFTR